MTGDEAKRKLREQGITLKKWAETNQFPYYMVSRVISGSMKANFGQAHDVAVKLGMKKGSSVKGRRTEDKEKLNG
jgi:gp16 family phage-associated protein